MDGADAVPVAPAAAATVVLLRPGPDGLEALLTHRPSTMAFAAGMHVFPGGRVDVGDASPALARRSAIDAGTAAEALGGDIAPDAALAAHVAAIREAWEESGVLLADTTHSPHAVARARADLVHGSIGFEAVAEALDLRLRTDRLRPLSRWVTPPGYARRFDVRFFAAVVPGDVVAAIGGTEVTALAWMRPADALDGMADRRLGMWLPTSSTLQQLEHVADPADLERLAPGRCGEVRVDELDPSIVRVVMPAGGGVAGQPVCAYLVGRRRLVLVDPGDPTGPALERCLHVAHERGAAIAAIALTHADPDHHAGAEALAERLAIPVVAGRGAGRRLPYAVRELDDDAVVRDGDVPMRVLATPGPRPDHVAFVVDDAAAVLTGDLDGRRGERSIPGPPDERAWAASRSRVDAVGGPDRRFAGHPARS